MNFRYIKIYFSEYAKNIKVNSNNMNWVSVLFTIGLGVLISHVLGIFLSWQSSKEVSGLVLSALVLGYVLLISRPKFIDAALVVGNLIEISDIDKIVGNHKKVAVIGAKFVGKTTFIDNVVLRKSKNTQTSSPYIRIVSIPDTDCAFLVMMDTVGRRDFVQKDIAEISDVVVVFVDHAETNELADIDEDRLRMQMLSLTQIVNGIKDRIEGGELRRRNAIIVANKSELWSSNKIRSARMDKFVDQLRKNLMESNKFGNIRIVPRHSNRLAPHAAVLIEEINNA